MTKKTHVAAGIAITLPLLNLVPGYAFIGILGATIPDWDLTI